MGCSELRSPNSEGLLLGGNHHAYLPATVVVCFVDSRPGPLRETLALQLFPLNTFENGRTFLLA
jgi:hypothetical protein